MALYCMPAPSCFTARFLAFLGMSSWFNRSLPQANTLPSASVATTWSLPTAMCSIFASRTSSGMLFKSMVFVILVLPQACTLPSRVRPKPKEAPGSISVRSPAISRGTAIMSRPGAMFICVTSE